MRSFFFSKVTLAVRHQHSYSRSVDVSSLSVTWHPLTRSRPPQSLQLGFALFVDNQEATQETLSGDFSSKFTISSIQSHSFALLVCCCKFLSNFVDKSNQFGVRFSSHTHPSSGLSSYLDKRWFDPTCLPLWLIDFSRSSLPLFITSNAVSSFFKFQMFVDSAEHVTISSHLLSAVVFSFDSFDIHSRTAGLHQFRLIVNSWIRSLTEPICLSNRSTITDTHVLLLLLFRIESNAFIGSFVQDAISFLIK